MSAATAAEALKMILLSSRHAHPGRILHYNEGSEKTPPVLHQQNYTPTVFIIADTKPVMIFRKKTTDTISASAIFITILRFSAIVLRGWVICGIQWAIG